MEPGSLGDEKMRENVLRSFQLPVNWQNIACLEIPPGMNAEIRLEAKRDEPLASLLIPSTVAYEMAVSIQLHRKDAAEPMVILENASGAAFVERSSLRLPFHGSVNEGDYYVVKLSNMSEVSFRFVPSAIVDQG